MTIKLPFLDRIKMLSRDLINGNDLALNRPRSYEVEILPSPTQRGSQQDPLSSAHAVKAAAPLLSARDDRLWSASQESGRDVEHTRSNLG